MVGGKLFDLTLKFAIVDVWGVIGKDSLFHNAHPKEVDNVGVKNLL